MNLRIFVIEHIESIMQQEDFIKREIERIGAIISAVRQLLFGGKDNLSIVLEKQMDDIKGMLRRDTGFDIDKFLSMNDIEADSYVDNLRGYSIENVELLAEVLSRIGHRNQSHPYMEKALLLYQHCNAKDKNLFPATRNSD